MLIYIYFIKICSVCYVGNILYNNCITAFTLTGLDRRIRDNQIAIRRRQTELSSTPAPLVIDICRINTRHNLGRDTRKREQNAEVRTHTIMGQECKRRRYNGEDAVGSRQGGMEEQETTEQEDNDIIMRDVSTVLYNE